MPAPLFDYADYHRTIIGYHGTTVTTADNLVNGNAFEESKQDDDWLGSGVYFWEYAPKQAWWWAEGHKKFNTPAVVGAVIRLGNCFDLLDPRNIPVSRQYYESLKQQLIAVNQPIPVNVRSHRCLDCAVFDYLYKASDQAGSPIDSARAVYVPTSKAHRVWEGSWIYDEAHIQICVRQTKNILAVWHVRRDGRYGKESS